jgi:hypothetical protein
MRKALLTAVLFLVLPCYEGASQTLDYVLRICVMVVTPTPTNASLGTGFLVTDDSTNLFVVTAYHVQSEFNTKTIIIFRGAESKPVKVQLILLNPQWATNYQADVAVAKLTLSPEIRASISRSIKAINVNNIIEAVEAPSRDLTLIMLGFPNGLGYGPVFSPISRRGNTASDLIDLTGHYQFSGPFFLMECPSVGGFSGGPVLDAGLPELGSGVITFTEGKRLVGVVSGNAQLPQTGLVSPGGNVRKLIKQLQN